MYFLVVALLSVLVPELLYAGTINRPTKSNLQTSFTTGMTPTAADLNGDPDTIYNEFNGNITNANISASAAIAGSKLNPDGLTVNPRVVNSNPCITLDDSDQSANLKRIVLCAVNGTLKITSNDDAGAQQGELLTITRSNGGFAIGGSGANIIQGATTFNSLVTFNGGNTLLPTGTVAAFVSTTPPAGWLNMNGASNNCMGSAQVNAALCTMLVGLHPGVNYKGSANGSITVDTGSNEIIAAGHGVDVNHRVHFTSSGTLPSPLSSNSVYCVISKTADRFIVSTSCGGGAVDITTTGSGTHSWYDKFVTPNMAGRVPVGHGNGSGLTPRTLGQTGGEESHTLTVGEMPSHNHEILVSPTTAGAGGGLTPVNGTQDINKFTENTGGGGAHNVMDPFLVLSYIIKL